MKPSLSNFERRIFGGSHIEIRAKAEGGAANMLFGYAAKFDVLSDPIAGFREQIAPGAFSDVLEDDVRALFNHDVNHVLGRRGAGTLRIHQDETGLSYEVDLPDTQAARDLVVSVDRGDVSQSSFAFRVAPNGDTWDENEDGIIIRTITKLSRLYDVSPVTYPAYPDATVAKRSLESWQATRQTGSQALAEARRADSRRRLLALRR